jgi:outer membrane protein TolC
MRRTLVPAALLAGVLAFRTGPGRGTAQQPSGVPQAGPPPGCLPAHTRPGNVAGLRPAPACATDRPLSINLATALRLADARPVVIEAARAAVETEYGLLEQARVLWLPTVSFGADYQRHDGGEENVLTGQLILGSRNQFLGGVGAQAIFALTDTIYAPLAERQLVRARGLEVQTAKNEALLAVALAYFDVQQARGILAGSLDSVARARDLARRVGNLGRGLAPAIEVERVYALLADLEQQAATARQDWLTSSAALTQVLRLDPAAVVEPLEPPHLNVTLISKEPVDSLIPVGLLNRPELATQQAVVRATLARLRQERMRPLLPSLVLQSNATPTGYLGPGLTAPAGPA